MSLTEFQSAPGHRIKVDGKEVDIYARVASDSGTLVILNDAESGEFVTLVSEGLLRDREGVEFVSTTAWAKTPDDERAAQQAATSGIPQSQATPTTGTTNAELSQILSGIQGIAAAQQEQANRLDAIEKAQDATIDEGPKDSAPEPYDPATGQDGPTSPTPIPE